MSVINAYKDPVTGKEMHFGKGSIKFISIKPVKDGPNVENGVKTTWIKVPGQADKKIESTHSISFLMLEVDDQNNIINPAGEGEWISMGEKKLNPNYADKVQVKVGEVWKDILPGMIISVPLKVSQNGDRTYVNASLAKLNILDESKAGAAPQRPAGQSSAGGQPTGAGTKVFGEITELTGSVASVQDEKAGLVNVHLGDAELSQVQVGGRLAAFINADGTIKTGFKAYGPAGQNSGGTFKRKGGYDQVGVEAGHATNGVGFLIGAGFKFKDSDAELEAGKIVHTVTAEMKAVVAERTGKSLDEVGAAVGNAVLNGCKRSDPKTKDLASEIRGHAEIVLEKLATPLYAFIKGNVTPDVKETPQKQPEALKQPPKQELPPVDAYANVPIDFDDAIPF